MYSSVQQVRNPCTTFMRISCFLPVPVAWIIQWRQNPQQQHHQYSSPPLTFFGGSITHLPFSQTVFQRSIRTLSFHLLPVPESYIPFLRHPMGRFSHQHLTVQKICYVLLYETSLLHLLQPYKFAD